MTPRALTKALVEEGARVEGVTPSFVVVVVFEPCVEMRY
jgi:hypothetical protein